MLQTLIMFILATNGNVLAVETGSAGTTNAAQCHQLAEKTTRIATAQSGLQVQGGCVDTANVMKVLQRVAADLDCQFGEGAALVCSATKRVP